MANLAYVKFQSFIEAVFEKKHNLGADALKIYLTNTAPNAATHTVKADLAEIAGGNGYTAGGYTVTVTSSSQTGGNYALAVSGTSTVTATGTIGPYRYAVLYNDTATNKELIGYWDIGSAITLASGDSHAFSYAANLITAS